MAHLGVILTTKTKQQLCFCYISLLETWSVIVNLIYIRYLYVSYKNEIGWIMEFNVSFNNISVISVEYPKKTTDLPQVIDKLLSHNVVSSTQRNEWGSNSQL
jgi:hypothetical protein